MATDPHPDIGTMELLAQELARLLEPVTAAATSTDPALGLIEVLADAGWDIESDEYIDSINALASAASAAAVELQSWAQGSGASGSWGDAFANIKRTITAILSLNDDATNLGADLLGSLVVRYLRFYRSGVFNWLHFFGILDAPRESPENVRVRLETLQALISDPRAHLAQVYHWNDNFQAGTLIERIAPLLRHIGIPAQVEFYPDSVRSLLTIEAEASEPDPELRISLVKAAEGSSFAELGLRIIGLESVEGESAIAFVPFGTATFAETISIGAPWELRFKASADAQRPHAAVLRHDGLEVRTFEAASAQLQCDVSFDLRKRTGAVGTVVLGTPSGSHVRVKSVGLHIQASYGQKNEIAVSLPVEELGLVIGAGSADGFLKKLLPPDGIQATTDFETGWRSEGGLFFRGSARLEVTIPLHIELGPVALDSLYIAIETADSGVRVSLGISVAGQLGPVAVNVQRIGIETNLSFEEGGNLGIVDISEPSFLPPRGGGLAIAAGPLTGGGFFDVDSDAGRYSGILQLKFGDIGLVAIAIVTTKLPGGKDGYALFVNIGVTFSPPITLPYNFYIDGCGGMLALNRRMDVEALRAGLRNKTLDSILFPKDPILNATKIINDSERCFPIAVDRYFVFPMAKGGWGPNGIVKFALAIGLEFPAPFIVAILGQIKARFPKPEEAKVKLNLDVLGVIEFEKKTFSLDATLYDSKIVTYDLSGDSALRMRWGDKPVFAMSIGGFHPKFHPPPKFPKLRRLKLQLSSSNSFDLSGKVYQALTSNTLQFGAAIELHAEACGATLDGGLSFDTLFYFSPFSFSTDIRGCVAGGYKGHDISVRLSMELSGPNPWHAKGSASVSVLCWDVTAKFNETWGNDNKVRLPSIDPWVDFQNEVALASNWGAGLLPKRSAVEALAPPQTPPSTPPAETASTQSESQPATPSQPEIVVHPAGRLEVKQHLLPLGMTLERLGNNEVTGHHKFDLSLHVGPPDATNEALGLEEIERLDHFAIGQFKDLSSSDRLSRASYEERKAGVMASPLYPRIDGSIQPCALQYESIFIGADGVTRDACIDEAPKWLLLRDTLRLNAAVLAKTAGLSKFSAPGVAPLVTVREEAFKVIQKSSLTAAAVPQSANAGRRLTQTEALQLTTGDSMAVPDFEEEIA